MWNGFGVSPMEMLASDAMLAGKVFCQEFDYVARFVAGTTSALPATGEMTVPVLIDASSDFVIQCYNGTAYDTDEVIEPDPDYLVSLSTDNKNFSSGPVAWVNLFGSYAVGRVPGRLSYPLLMRARSTLNVKLQNLTATAPGHVDLLFHGFKVYYTGAMKTEDVFHVL